jgi:hypothetical protein
MLAQMEVESEDRDNPRGHAWAVVLARALVLQGGDSHAFPVRAFAGMVAQP